MANKDDKGFSILKHRLVPKHEILSEAEKINVIERNGGDPYMFPLIWVSDPVAKAIEASVGDLIKVTRDSPTGHKTIYYRFVVEE